MTARPAALLAPAALAVALCAAPAAQGEIVYFENFEGLTGPPAGYSGFENFGGFFDNGTTANGTRALFLDAGFGANAGITYDSGAAGAPIAVNPGDTITLAFDLIKTETNGPGSTDFDYVGDVFFGVTGATFAEPDNFGVAPGTAEGPVALTLTATSAGTLSFFVDLPAVAGDPQDYSQVELDNFAIDVSPVAAVPEPGTVLLAGVAALAARRRRA